MRKLFVLCLFVACVDDGTCPSVVEECGPRPLYPGSAVAFDGDRATMTRESWLALDAWSTDIRSWADCAGRIAP